MDKPAFFAILPAAVRYDARLKPMERILYGEITALADQTGYCYASNRYFIELYSAGERTVQGWIKNLTDCGYITVEMFGGAGQGRCERRMTPIFGLRDIRQTPADLSATPAENCGDTPAENCAPPPQKTAGRTIQDNNTSNNSGRKLNIASLVVNINKEDTNVILGRECVTLYGRPYIEDYIGDIKFQISPLSFFQVNPKQTEVLYNKALEFANLTGNEAVWDLYCGIGTISLFLAKNAGMVYGVEIVPQAIEDAKNNAGINGIDNAEFFVGKAEEVVTAFYESRKADDGTGHNMTRPDVIVVDPPRKGCDEKLLDTIVTMSPQRVVYVSCDSATLARDLKVLSERGYKIVKVQPVDQFANTVHVESVVLMQYCGK